MAIKKLFGAFATTLALLGASAVSANEIQDFSSAVRGIDTGGGVDIRGILPRFVVSNTSGVPTRFTFWFDVYRPGVALADATRLFGTPQRAVAFPALPCATPVPGTTAWEFKPKFFGHWGGRRAHAVHKIRISCFDQTTGFREKYLAFVYSADISQVVGGAFTGTVWTKAYPLELAGASGLDLDRDGINEALMLTMKLPDAQGTSFASRDLIMNFNDGAVFKDQTFKKVVQILFN